MMRVGVLASGSGSNFSALIDALHRTAGTARVEVVVCNVPGAGVLQKAQAAKVPTELVDHTRYPTRGEFDAALVEALRRHRVEVVCLAGFMRLVGRALLDAFPQRVLNVHPALLPSFPGLHAARQALLHGVKVTGCTVHFVDEGTDTGPIIAQAAVPVLDDDDEATLQKRIQTEEHRLFPQVVHWLAEGRVRVDGRRVSIGGAR